MDFAQGCIHALLYIIPFWLVVLLVAVMIVKAF